VLLGAPTTADWHGLSSDVVFSFYPRLAFANEGLRLEKWSQQDVVFHGENVQINDTNSHWKNACGPYCPIRRRKTYDDDGYAAYIWNVSPTQVNRGGGVFDPMIDEKRNELTYSARMGWTVLSRCSNTACAQGKAYDSRREYVDP
jgi:hypothetical protein